MWLAAAVWRGCSSQHLSRFRFLSPLPAAFCYEHQLLTKWQKRTGLGNFAFLLHLLIWSEYCLHPHVSFLASASFSLFNHLPSPSSLSPHPPFYRSPKSIPPFCSCSYPPHWPPLCTAAPIQPLISEVPLLWRTLWVCVSVSVCHTVKSRTND